MGGGRGAVITCEERRVGLAVDATGGGGRRRCRAAVKEHHEGNGLEGNMGVRSGEAAADVEARARCAVLRGGDASGRKEGDLDGGGGRRCLEPDCGCVCSKVREQREEARRK